MRKPGMKLALVAMVVALAFGLMACGGSAGSRGPVYLKTKQVYYDTASGNVQSEMTWTHDGKGNTTKRVTKGTNNGSEVYVEDTYGDFDQDGYPATHSASNGTETRDSTYEYTKEDGKVTKAVESNGAETEYTYYENGKVKTLKSTSSSGSVSLYEYDEDGYGIKNQSTGGSGGDANRTIMWTKDDSGAPTEMVFNSASSGSSQIPVSYSIQCDDNGNIIRVYTALGKLYEEVEYEKVDSPSLAAWVNAYMISG